MDLGFVVRVGQLGVQDEPEAWMEEALFVSYLNATVKEMKVGEVLW